MDWGDSWDIADRAAEATAPDIPSVPAASPAANLSVEGNSVSVTIPLNITISLGAPQIGTGVPAPPAREEGWFGGDDDQEIIARAYRRFSTHSLGADNFSWPAAVSAGAASNLAYDGARTVTDICRNQFGFDACQFIRADDTECFVAATDDQVLLSFRGTAGTADWIRDLTLFSVDSEFGSVHQGFYYGLLQAKPQIEDALDAFDAGNKKFVITGHSLGGALAILAAADLDGAFPVTGVYTYGQPAVGKRDFRAYMLQRFSSRLFRIVNDDDIVPMVPPGYVHVGRLYHFGSRGSVAHESMAEAGEVETPTMSVVEFQALQERCALAGQLESTRGLEGLLPSFSDHSMVQYLKKLMQQN
jgi:hypothetical protein